jgi:hypothetical protein
MKRSNLRLMMSVLVLSLSPVAPILFGQTAGTILGTVVDPQGGLVPGASITAKQAATGASRVVTSDNSGNYVLALLGVGDFDLTVEASGFAEAISHVVLQAQQSERVDFTLKVGAVSDQTTVVADAAMLKVDSSEISSVVDNQRMVELPMNGRNFIALGALDAGSATQAGARTNYVTSLFGGNYSFNGSPGDSSTYSIDGIMAKGFVDVRVTVELNVDAVQEMNQQTSLYSAQYSGGGGNVNVVTKSGTDHYHGSAWEFFRNSALDARNFFDPAKTSPFRQNQFGSTMGGPVKKNKLFFFAAVEVLRKSKSVGQLFSVPTPAQRSGNFAGIANIYDPLSSVPNPANPAIDTRTQFSGNVIPPSQVDKVAQAALAALFPLPNLPGLTRNLSSAFTNATNDKQVLGRGDYRFSDKNTAYVRMIGEWPVRYVQTFAQLPNFADNWNDTSIATVIGDTWVITNQLVNEYHMGFNRHYQTLESTLKNVDINDQLGITGTYGNIYPGPPGIGITGYGRTGGIGSSPNDRGEDLFQVADNLSYAFGKHALIAGFDVRNLREDGGTQSNSRGSFTFTNNYSALPGVAGSGSAVADYVLGYPANATVSIGNGYTDEQQFLSGLYIADDWKATKHLTLNLGLRYEYFTPLWEVHNRIPSFNFETGKEYAIGTGGVSNYLWNPQKMNFAPRFGLAFQPFGEKTVIRAGYGLFYSPPLPALGWSTGSSAPNLNNATTVNTPNIPNLTLDNAFPPALLQISPAVVVIDRNLKTPYNQEWTLDVQRQVMKNTVLDVAYLGNKGTHIIGGPRNYDQAVPGLGAVSPRRPYPAYTSISLWQSDGRSTYESLHVNLKRQLFGGLTYTASYVWSHMLDTIDSEAVGAGASIKRDLRNPSEDYANSTFDARHRFVFNAVWALPLGKGRFRTNWQLSGIFTKDTGTPIDVGMATDNSNTGDAGSNDRPNCVGNPNANAPHTVLGWFNKAAFAAPTPFTFGNCGRSVILGPGVDDTDVLLSKTFVPWEGIRVQFRAEIFNIFNHTAFDSPNATFGNPAFGQIASAGDARETQFAIKVAF